MGWLWIELRKIKTSSENQLVIWYLPYRVLHISLSLVDHVLLILYMSKGLNTITYKCMHKHFCAHFGCLHLPAHHCQDWAPSHEVKSGLVEGCWPGSGVWAVLQTSPLTVWTTCLGSRVSVSSPVKWEPDWVTWWFSAVKVYDHIRL